MSTGDRSDFAARLGALIPHGWFANGLSPLRDALLQGIASGLSFAFSLLVYVRAQTRIATASDGFVDMIAGDFFGDALRRQAGQTDASFRAVIIANLFRERGTRAAVSALLMQLTGRAPLIFEPTRPADTGAYGGPTLGYGVAGGYGSLLLPYQAFVTAYRPEGFGVPSVAGYGISTGGYSTPSQASYVSIYAATGALADNDIYAAIESMRPVGTQIWVRLTS